MIFQATLALMAAAAPLATEAMQTMFDSSLGVSENTMRTLAQTQFSGDLTYYGGAGAGGACTQDYVPPGFTTVAINGHQYANGGACGTCVNACFDDKFLGQGQRCVNAIVDNNCPECKFGDLDLGDIGSGRWPVSWKIIKCPSSTIRMSAQSSNAFFAKVKAQGGPSSVISMTCNGIQGNMTPDGFFTFNSGTGGFKCGMDCTFTFGNGFGMGRERVTPALLGTTC